MNDRRQIFGWVMYDWANSAYMTTVTAAIHIRRRRPSLRRGLREEEGTMWQPSPSTVLWCLMTNKYKFILMIAI